MSVPMDELKKYENVYKSSLDALRLNVEVSFKDLTCLSKEMIQILIVLIRINSNFSFVTEGKRKFIKSGSSQEFFIEFKDESLIPSKHEI